MKAMRDSKPHQIHFESIWIENLLHLFKDKSPKFLEGRIILMLANLKIKNIEFWLELELTYLKVIEQEQTYKKIEALNGFALANRG